MKRILLALVLMPLASCQLERELNPALGPGELYGSVEQPSDLPVPRALQLRVGVNQSRSLSHRGFRSAYLKYDGRISLSELRKFLRDRLPDHGWSLRNEDQPAQERLIQHWVQDRDGGVRHLLLAEIETEGGVSRLSYDLRTTRKQAHTKAAEAKAEKAEQK